jgi:hypothetical protein
MGKCHACRKTVAFPSGVEDQISSLLTANFRSVRLKIFTLHFALNVSFESQRLCKERIDGNISPARIV